MPQFFFHVRTGLHLVEDEIGVELADFDAVRREALRGMADMLRDAALTGQGLSCEAFEVTDGGGRPILTMSFDQKRVG